MCSQPVFKEELLGCDEAYLCQLSLVIANTTHAIALPFVSADNGLLPMAADEYFAQNIGKNLLNMSAGNISHTHKTAG